MQLLQRKYLQVESGVSERGFSCLLPGWLLGGFAPGEKGTQNQTLLSGARLGAPRMCLLMLKVI